MLVQDTLDVDMEDQQSVNSLHSLPHRCCDMTELTDLWLPQFIDVNTLPHAWTTQLTRLCAYSEVNHRVANTHAHAATYTQLRELHIRGDHSMYAVIRACVDTVRELSVHMWLGDLVGVTENQAVAGLWDAICDCTCIQKLSVYLNGGDMDMQPYDLSAYHSRIAAMSMLDESIITGRYNVTTLPPVWLAGQNVSDGEHGVHIHWKRTPA